MRPLNLSSPTDTTIEIIAVSKPQDTVYGAHTESDLVKRWLTGPAGHSMPECDVDLLLPETI